MALQSWIHHWELGAGKRLLRISVALLAFVAMASFYDWLSYEGYSSEEAMETAQLARNVSEGKGYTTDSIRPLALYYLASAAEPGQSSKVLAGPAPDVSNAPVYPFLLAGLMKALPFKFAARQFLFYEPELWISVFNQALFFAATILLFFLARRLFDRHVAWLTAVLFAGTNLFWKFTTSGLSTIWLMLIFLGMVWFMTGIEMRERMATEETAGKSVLPAVMTGLLAGVGGLSRYAFAWMVVPVLVYVWLSVRRGRFKLCATIAASFLVVMAPWVARNFLVSGHCFGTAGMAMVQGTPAFPEDTLERSTDPRYRMTLLAPADIANKFLANARAMLSNDLPKLGGNWISAFFLAGMCIAFRNLALTRLRWFVVGSLILVFVVQGLGQTHVSTDMPEINSENLLVLLAPLVFMFGAALFYTLLEQLNLALPDLRGIAVIIFVTVMCAPFLFALSGSRRFPVNWPYWPRRIHQVASWVRTNDLMMSDIPSGVAWYGEHPCIWLSLDDERDFYRVNGLKPVKGLFLTQVTTDKRFLSQMKSDPKDWGQFVLECAEHGEVPTGFPLRKAPLGLLPDQLFLSDAARWQEQKTKP